MSDGESTAMPEGSDAPNEVAGERGVPVVARARSLQAKFRQGFAGLVLALVAAGFLAWYYARLAGAESNGSSVAERVKRQQMASELKLPPLPAAPFATATEHVIADPATPESQEAGPPAWASEPAELPPAETPREFARAELLQQKQMAAPVWVAVSAARGRSGGGSEGDGRVADAGSAGSALGGLLTPTVLPATVAGVVPTARFLLPKGSFIDCTLETAIDSTLPGLVTCITAVDVFGADGSVVLLERGSKLIGEVGQGVRIGQRRLFVLWNEARTPAGIVVPLASPATDALGRSGLGGTVDTHFGERFGAALLISVIEGASEVAASSQRDAAVFVDPRGMESVTSEIIRRTADIPPTIRVVAGARVNVLVARDVDFRRVYALRARDAAS
ncbi:MAG: TrbI/VirB10 family protein [Dehalococcoidia bacterium]